MGRRYYDDPTADAAIGNMCRECKKNQPFKRVNICQYRTEDCKKQRKNKKNR